jgi:hypothetical protein
VTTRQRTQPIDEPTGREHRPLDQPRPTHRRRWVALAVATALVTAGAGTTVFRHGADSAPVSRTAPIQLPAQVQGFAPLAASDDPLMSKEWRQRAQVASNGATLAFKAYGSTGLKRTIRVVAARADLAGLLALSWAVDAGRRVGEDRCTQNVRLVPRGTAGIRPTVMLCWRTSSALSAYALIIDPKHTVKDVEGVAALDQVWSEVAKG